MKLFFKSSIIVGFLMVLLTGSVSGPLLAQDSTVGKTESELKVMQEKIRQAELNKQRAAQEERSVLRQIEGINQRIRSSSQQLNRLEGEVNKNERTTQQLQSELLVAQSRLNQHQLYLALRVRSIYRAKSVSPFRQILASEDYASQIRNFQYMRILAYTDAKALSNVRYEASKIRRQEFRISEMLRYQKAQQQEISISKQKYEGENKQKQSLLSRIRTDKATYDRTVRELQAAVRRLENLLAELRAKQVKFPEGYAGGNFSQSRGRLGWPVAGGSVIYNPGKHKILEGQVEVYSHGIGIKAPVGTAVYSVHDGMVRYAGWLEGSGNTIIIDHGEGYMTLYMHLSGIAAQKGTVVKRRQYIGAVGDTGSLEGPQLEFQIRKGTATLNPHDWLANR